jgi:hypothetical protein
MNQIATYNQARSLKHALSLFGIAIKPETFDMTTSGIYIPRWLGYSHIPHAYDKATGVAQWYFFFRFVIAELADLNVGEALSFANTPGAMISPETQTNSFGSLNLLVERIRSNERYINPA